MYMLFELSMNIDLSLDYMPQIVCGTGTDGTVIRNVSDVFHDPFSYCPLAFHRRKHQHITLLLELTREKRQVFEK